MLDTLFIAVDLGAGSGRVFLCGIGADELSLEEIRRFHYPPRIKNGRMRWDFSLIFDEIKAASNRQPLAPRNLTVRSIASALIVGVSIMACLTLTAN